MEILSGIPEMQSKAEALRRAGRTIGIIPTMGFLHEGHLSLIRLACSATDVVVTTLFVNPAQFGPGEDFERYPRDVSRDESLSRDAGSDILFCPDANAMYPKGYGTYVVTEDMAARFEGAIRPTHFRGVTTVVTKLFHIVRPHVAVFGQKDAQQVAIIRRMVKDLDMDIRIMLGPIVREPDGLAMSSRNIYLNPDERKNATALFRSLLFAKEAASSGERRTEVLRRGMISILEESRASAIDYIAFVQAETFQEIRRLEPPEALAVLAVRFGRTRLIDNIIIPVPEAKS